MSTQLDRKRFEQIPFHPVGPFPMTTIDDLRRLSDDQLIEKVAEEVMGSIGHKWNPLADWNHTMQIVERLVAREPNGDFHMEHFTEEWRVGYCRMDEWLASDPDLRRAICLSALIAVSD
jgi:hypothetical protein